MYTPDDQKKTKFPTVQGPIAAWKDKAQARKQQPSLSSAIRSNSKPTDPPEKILHDGQTNNKTSAFIEQISQEAEKKITEKQFQDLTEQLQITVLNDENLQQSFKQHLFESFKLFKQNHQIYEDKLTPELIQQFKKEFGFKLENAIYLNKFQIFQKLSGDHKELIVNKLTALFSENISTQQGVSIEQQRSFHVRKVLIDILLNEYLDLKTLVTIERSLINLTSNVLFSPESTNPEAQLERNLMIAVFDFKQLAQKHEFLKDYFNKNDADKQFIINYLLLAQEQGKTLEEDKQQVWNIIFQAAESNQQIQKEYQEYIKRLASEWNTTLIHNNPSEKADIADESGEDDWFPERRLLSRDLLFSLKIAFMHDQILKHPQICKALRINPQNNEIKKLEMQQVASNIFEHFECFKKFPLNKKMQLIQQFIDKVNDINDNLAVPNASTTTLSSNIGAIIIQLICEHNMPLNDKLPQEKMILEAINKFNEIVNDQNSQTLSSSNDFKKMKYTCINQLLECNKKYAETIGVWPKAIARLMDSQAVKSLQTIGESIVSKIPPTAQQQLSNRYNEVMPQHILAIPSNLRDLTGVTEVREIESTIRNIKDRISQTILEVFKGSKEINNQYEKLKRELPFTLINTHDGKLKAALEQQLLEVLALQSQKTELSSFVDAEKNYLEVFKKEIFLAVMLSNIYAFRCLTVDLQLDVIQALYDCLSKIDSSLPIKENDTRTEALSKVVKTIAMHSNLMSFIENTMELHKEESGLWDRFKGNITNILGNKRVQGGGAGFVIGMLLSRGRISGGIIGAALGATQPTLMNKLILPLKKFATPFNYIAKEIIDIYRNPLGYPMANRIIRGSTIVIAGTLIAPAVYAASYIAPLAGSVLGIFGGVAIVAGAIKLTHIISDKIKPLSTFEASEAAKLQWGQPTAQETLDYLANRLAVVKNILQNQQFHSDEAEEFLKDLNDDLQNAVTLIQEGQADGFRSKWASNDGNRNDTLRGKLYQLVNYEHENKIFVNDLEERHLYKFSKILLVNWCEKRSDFNIRSDHNKTELLDFTTSLMEECNELLINVININNKILPPRETETEAANKAKLDELIKLQAPLMVRQPQSQQYKLPPVTKAKVLSFGSSSPSIPDDNVNPILLSTKEQNKP